MEERKDDTHSLRYYMANKYEGDVYEMDNGSNSSSRENLGSLYSSEDELRLSGSSGRTGSEKNIYYKIYDFVIENSHDNLRSSSSSFFGQPQGKFLKIVKIYLRRNILFLSLNLRYSNDFLIYILSFNK